MSIKLTSPIEKYISNFLIDHTSKIMVMGSCFSETIGQKLKGSKFNVDVNPFGIIYNPESVFNSIDLLIKNRKFTQADLMFHNDLWLSFYHHSKFGSTDKDKCLNNINMRLGESHKLLKQANYLFLTFGTARIFKYKKSGITVSNCHKIPANQFERILLKPDEIVKKYEAIISMLQKFNPVLKIIFTVSPVRHLKDGAIGNQISKSTLVLAVHELISKFQNTEYFPSYELLLDELRDYRYYDEDLAHPNKLAVNVIWQCFSDVYFTRQTKQLNEKILQISKDLSHRPFNPESKNHKAFLKTLENKIKKIKNEHPYLQFFDDHLLTKT